MRSSDLRKVTKKSKTKLSINILGPESLSENVAATLDENKVFLQHPYALEAGVDYINPHFYQPAGRMVMTHMVGMDQEQLKAKQLSDEVDGILASLDSPANEALESSGMVSQSDKILVSLKE
jgi:tryptophan synthase beta subunit